MSKLLKHTEDFLQQANIKDRKSKGQYFTNKTLKDKSLKNISFEDDMDILENSCGTGEFIYSILEINENVNIDAFDIDASLVAIIKDKYPNVNVVCADWLLSGNYKKYDKIIGNPPYFEISKASSCGKNII